MGHLTRYSGENQCYHLITRARDGTAVFGEAANATVVVDALQFLRLERAYVLGYVVMPDHLHVVLVPRGDWTISGLMQSIKGFSARAINATTGRVGPLWQRSFFDRAITGEPQLIQTLEYIHSNPVAAGLVKLPEEYRFSSAHLSASTDLETFLSGGDKAGA
jgi:REP element-mobilizing transposase RayT